MSAPVVVANAGLAPRRFVGAIVGLGLAALAACAAGVLIGPSDIEAWGGFGRILDGGLGEAIGRAWRRQPASTEELVLLSIRPLRVSLALVAGSALATAGVGFQAILRNPLADPYVLGISGGASLAVAVAFVGLPTSLLVALGLGESVPPMLTPLFSFVGACAATLLILVAARSFAAWSGERLILVGVIANAIWSAFILVLTVMVPFGRLPGLSFWLMGLIDEKRVDLATVAVSGVAALVGLAWLLIRARELNALAFGEETAAAVGVHPERTRRQAFLASALLTAAAVALAGPVGFVGLIVPHGLRMILGPDHRLLLPAAFLAGGAFLVIADTVARSVIEGIEIPVGAITALVGGPTFLLLLAKTGYGRGVGP